MNLYEDGLSHLFGLNPRKRVLKRAIAWTLVTASVVTPITFGHAMWDYGQSRAATIINWVIKPEMKAMQDNIDKQVRIAQLRNAKLQQQQKVQSGHK